MIAPSPAGGLVDGLPPGPRSQRRVAWRLVRDPLKFYAECAARYGDPFTIPTRFGPVVLTGRPEGIRQIYGAPPDSFVVFAPETVMPFLGAHSLMLLNGSRHAEDRRLIGTPLLGRRLQRYAGAIDRATRESTGDWSAGMVIVAQEAMHDLAFRVILKLFLGEEDPAEAELRQAFARVQAATHPSITLLSWLRRDFGGVGPWARFQRARRQLDSVVYRLIDRRSGDAEAPDLLGYLMSVRRADGSPLPREAIRDHLVSLLAAGHETVASALSWALYWIHRSRDTVDRLREELHGGGPDPSAEALQGLPYLDAVCNETLRMSPILPEVSRRFLEPMDFLGYRIPGNVAVGSIASIAHNDPELFPNPSQFRAERFIEARPVTCSYIPFGGGTHRCLGAQFALYEMKLVLGRLLSQWDFALSGGAGPKPKRARSIPFEPDVPITLSLKARAPASTVPAA